MGKPPEHVVDVVCKFCNKPKDPSGKEPHCQQEFWGEIYREPSYDEARWHVLPMRD